MLYKTLTAVWAITGTLLAQTSPGIQSTEEILTAFRKLRRSAQERALAEAIAAVDAIDDPWLRSVRRMAAAGPPADAEAAKFKFKGGRKLRGLTSRWFGQLAFPLHEEYDFATGVSVPLDKDGQYLKKKAKLRGKSAAADRQARLAAMLAGYPPELDLALAHVLARLDVDGPRRYAAFLVSWRNGKETFYDGLDRTAGTPEALFFYDAMQAEFLQRFVPRGHDDHRRLNASLDATHDALHEAFLNYRQYRAMREAVALTLLVPADVELPSFLQRYGRRPENGYSSRDMVGMLLALVGDDVERAVEDIGAALPPIPADLWASPHRPVETLRKHYDTRIPEMIERAKHTSKFREEWETRRTAIRDRIAMEVRKACRRVGLVGVRTR